MERLKEIKYDNELSEFDLSMTEPCTDRLMTKLTLHDYEWMEYKFETWLPTKKQGMLTVTATYNGTAESKMVVWQNMEGHAAVHTITFPAEVFEEFLKDFLIKHVKQWESDYAFCGGEEAVGLYNNVLGAAKSYLKTDGAI